MGTTTQTAALPEVSSPFALWHLLSLDAPTVAALWVCFIARSSHISLPLAAPVAMAIAVWMLYVADRLLDTRVLEDGGIGRDEFEARHLFHYRYRSAFLVGLSVAAARLTTLLPRLDPAAIHLYLIEGGLLCAWFVILHATRSAHRLPKEIAVGMFFSAAVFIPTIARQPALRTSLLPDAVLFAASCSLNCLFIYAWEHEAPAPPQLAHSTTRLAVAHLPTLTIATATLGLVLALFGSTPAKPVAAACTLCTCLLLTLHYNRRRFSRVELRAAADFALLTPIVLLPFLR